MNTSKLTKYIIGILTAIAVVSATVFVYLDDFGVVEAPEEVKEIFEAKDSLIETIEVDTNEVK